MAFYSKKGFFTIITSFFLVVLFIFSLMALFYFSGITKQINKKASNNIDYLVNIGLFKDQLMLCHEKTTLLEKTLEDGKCSDLIEGIKGYSVEKQNDPGCSQKRWDFGDVSESNGNHIFWVPVQQENNSKNCLAKLIVYY